MDSRKIGILGGGQLGRMLVEAAHRLNVKTVILDTAEAPAKQINAMHPHIDGSFTNQSDVRKLGQQCDLLTMEIEHVDTAILEQLQRWGGMEVQPGWKTIRTIQDKYLQKKDLMDRGVAVARSVEVTDGSVDGLKKVGGELGYPFMLKSRTLAYDGRGNFAVKKEGDIPAAAEALKGRPLYAEEWAEFSMELAVMVIKQKDGNCLSYPTVETIHENNICKLVYAPARNVSSDIRDRARQLAEKAVKGYEGAGVFGVEMFLMKNGDAILVNEIAPRPHNSGHYTIETHATSQYEAHLRAILGLPIPQEAVEFRTPDTNAIMLNILGGPELTSHLGVCKMALETPGATLHLYGKKEARRGRKMGHVTVVAGSMADAESRIKKLVRATEYEIPPPPPTPAPTNTSMGDKVSPAAPTNTSSIGDKVSSVVTSAGDKVSSLAGAIASFPGSPSTVDTPSSTAPATSVTSPTTIASTVLTSFPNPNSHENTHHQQQAHTTTDTLPRQQSSIPGQQPKVAVIMGSDSDLPTMAPAMRTLDKFNIPYSVDIVSAHRTASKMFAFASSAESQGYRVIIAGAGGAAHLPGMVASETVLPVIGVPVKASVLDGLDSLFSINQMPRGCPVATVGINNSTNAALLAVRMLGVGDADVRGKMKNYQDDMKKEVEGKSEKVRGDWEGHLARMQGAS